MSLERVRKSIQNFLGIQNNPQNQKSTLEPKKYQTEQKITKTDQLFKNKFVCIQKKENKLNSYKFALERLKEYNLIIFKANDFQRCPVISYLQNKQEKKINENENKATKPRWSETFFELIKVKPEDERKAFFLHAQYIQDSDKQLTQTKQIVKEQELQSKISDINFENNLDQEKQPKQIITQSQQLQEKDEVSQSGYDDIIVGQKSEIQFNKLQSKDFKTKQVILIQDKKLSQKNENLNNDSQEKQLEIQSQQPILTDPKTEQVKPEVIENKEESRRNIVTKLDHQIQNLEQKYILDENPFTQNIQNQLLNPPWSNNPVQEKQISQNIFQQPLIQQSPQISQQQPINFLNSIQQQSYNQFPSQNSQIPNVFFNQNLFTQEPNLFKNNQQSNQNFNLFNQQNLFQQQTSQQPQESLFQQQSISQSLFQQQQQPSSTQSLFQQQPSSQSLFQQQPSTQTLFSQQPTTESLFQQQSSINFFKQSGTQSQSQLFQQQNQQTVSLFNNNDQSSNQKDFFSAQPVNLFQSNQVQAQDLFSLNTEQQSNNTIQQQRSCSQSDRYKKNLCKQQVNRI
ncbi:unnamed protein product [Paramecium sonneborni]|uniref:Uncharacterized protein n=1 Tax=Paramecium sonneborni TaxID=65129 RepID=A0A8S1RCQ8_9CILI|nr:unnamed protein product [Paramecium sonneborni]